jgi:hypothetical protein
MRDRDVGVTLSNCDRKKLKIGRNSVLFCHASYEARSLGIIEAGAEENIVSSIVCFSEEYGNYPLYRDNKKKLVDGLNLISNGTVLEVEINRDRTVDFLRNIDSLISKMDQVSSLDFFVDISTFPRDRMICLLEYLMRLKGEESVISFLYTSPASYGSELEGGWLTRGVRKMAPIPNFNGKQKTNRKLLLIMLLGHEAERAHITLRNIEPDRVIVISQGGDQLNDDSLNTSIEAQTNILRDYQHCLSDSYSVGYLDPLCVKELISKIYRDSADEYNIIVSINGTKIQVVGAMLGCMFHREIQIIYAYPHVFNLENYSSSIGKSTLGRLTF